MKKKIRFNLLDAAILLVAAGLLLSFVFRAEISRFVSGAEQAEYTVAFTVVTTPDNADALTVGARLTDIILTLTLVSNPYICAILGTSVADKQIPTASRAC